VNLVARLNQGQDIGGQPIGTPTRFHLGVGFNPFAPNPEAEWRRLAHKIEAGAEFVMTPPVLDPAAFDAILPRLRDTGLPILAGVVALESTRQAEFFASEVVGAKVPDTLIDRLRAAADEAAEALAFTREVLDWLRSRVQGVQITSLHGRPETVTRLLNPHD
jgi:homocysteine S-methyltransferase